MKNSADKSITNVHNKENIAPEQVFSTVMLSLSQNKSTFICIIYQEQVFR